MKKVLLSLAVLITVSSGAMATDFNPKSDFNVTHPNKGKPHHPPRLVENKSSDSFTIGGGPCGFSCFPR